MENIVFLADINSSLGVALTKTYLQSGYTVFGVYSEGESAQESFGGLDELKNFVKSGEGNLFLEKWNRKSPAATKNLILKYQIRFGFLKEVVFLSGCALACGQENLPELNYAHIEKSIDVLIKGDIHLLKEITSGFQPDDLPVLAMVLPFQEVPRGFLAHTLSQAFQGMVEGLWAGSTDFPFHVAGFNTLSGNDEGFARFIHKTVTENNKKLSNKWYKYGLGFFKDR